MEPIFLRRLDGKSYAKPLDFALATHPLILVNQSNIASCEFHYKIYKWMFIADIAGKIQ